MCEGLDTKVHSSFLEKPMFIFIILLIYLVSCYISFISRYITSLIRRFISYNILRLDLLIFEKRHAPVLIGWQLFVTGARLFKQTNKLLKTSCLKQAGTCFKKVAACFYFMAIK